MRNLKSAVIVGAMLSSLASISFEASASPVTRQFEFSSTSGPLQFGPAIGSFTYDASVAPVGGGFVSGPGLFSALNVQFGTHSYNIGNATSGSLLFNAAGDLTGALFGNNCNGLGLGLCYTVPTPLQFFGPTSSQWLIALSSDVPLLNLFSYTGFGHDGFVPQVTFSSRLLARQSVPEPSSLLLAGLGLAAVAVMQRRRKSKQK